MRRLLGTLRLCLGLLLRLRLFFFQLRQNKLHNRNQQDKCYDYWQTPPVIVHKNRYPPKPWNTHNHFAHYIACRYALACLLGVPSVESRCRRLRPRVSVAVAFGDEVQCAVNGSGAYYAVHNQSVITARFRIMKDDYVAMG